MDAMRCDMQCTMHCCDAAHLFDLCKVGKERGGKDEDENEDEVEVEMKMKKVI